MTGGGAVLPNGWRGRIEVNQGTFTAVEDAASEPCRSTTLVPSSDFTCLNSLYLFANHQGVSNDLRFKDNNNVTCYGCRIYADAGDAEPVRDFVPVVRLSDGAVGMIDRANGNAWYGNAGSPAFVAGPAKAMPMTVGEVHFDIPKDETVTNSCLLLGGTIRVVKDGEGALVSGGVQTYYGGTQIDGGTFTVADAGAFGAALTEVMVNPSAILEMNGKYGFDNNTFNLAGGTLRNAGGDVDSGKAQIKYVRLTADSTMVIENSYGFIGNGSSEVNLDLGGHTLTVDVSDGKSFWFHDVTATAGRLTVMGAGTLAIDKTAVRASSTDFDLECATVSAAVNCDVGGWTVGANTTVSGNGTVTIHGAYRPLGDSVTKYVLANGATFDLSGRSTVFDIKEKNIAFADGAIIYVKPQPNIGGLVVPWTEPANFSDLTFVKAPNEKGWLTVDSTGITFRRGLVIFIR